MKSTFYNRDHDVVKIIIISTSTENITLYRGQSDNINGPDGVLFRYAWKTRNELITDAELNKFGADAVYGTRIVFGSPQGKAT